MLVCEANILHSCWLNVSSSHTEHRHSKRRYQLLPNETSNECVPHTHMLTHFDPYTLQTRASVGTVLYAEASAPKRNLKQQHQPKEHWPNFAQKAEKPLR